MRLDREAARLERQPVSVSSLCIAAAVPATTALRWIKTMTDAGLFVREADPHDGRRIFIALAEGACDALARYFEALEESARGVSLPRRAHYVSFQTKGVSFDAAHGRPRLSSPQTPPRPRPLIGHT